MDDLKPHDRILGKQESQLDSGLLQAYLETHYSAGDLVLRVGQRNDALRATHRSYGVTSSAFVTAWNSYSRAQQPAENARAHAQLKLVVRSSDWHAIDGIGQHPSNVWPGEESLLVFGPTLEEARTLGRQFKQNAIVWADEDAVPRLVLLR